MILIFVFILLPARVGWRNEKGGIFPFWLLYEWLQKDIEAFPKDGEGMRRRSPDTQKRWRFQMTSVGYRADKEMSVFFLVKS